MGQSEGAGRQQQLVSALGVDPSYRNEERRNLSRQHLENAAVMLVTRQTMKWVLEGPQTIFKFNG